MRLLSVRCLLLLSLSGCGGDKKDAKPGAVVVIEDAKPDEVQNARPGEVIEVEIAKGVKMMFCWIPAGTATLGSPLTEKERRDEEIEHEFTTKGFWLGKYPVTQQEWQAVMGNNPSRFSKNGE